MERKISPIDDQEKETTNTKEAVLRKKSSEGCNESKEPATPSPEHAVAIRNTGTKCSLPVEPQ